MVVFVFLPCVFASEGDLHHLGVLWAPEDQPVGWYQQDVREGSLPGDVDAATGLTYQEAVVLKGWCNWRWNEEVCDPLLDSGFLRWDESGSCAELGFEYLGCSAVEPGFVADGVSMVSWDDPQDQLGTGVLAAALGIPGSGPVEEIDGRYYAQLEEADIVFNDNVVWATTEDVLRGACSGAYSVESVATHEVGHAVGLDHTCEEGFPCLGEGHGEAVMNYQLASCVLDQVTPNHVDLHSFEALYGSLVTVHQVPDPASGPAPLEVTWIVEVDETVELDELHWTFGDHHEHAGDALEVTHAYEEQGQHTPSVEISGSSEVCDELSRAWSNLAGVSVCTAPTAVFSAQPHEGLTWQLVNLTEMRTVGCIDEVVWTVERGGIAIQRVSAWAPKIVFPEPGDYTVVLELAGPAGASAAELEVSVGRFGGCSGVPGGGVGWLVLALGWLTPRRARPPAASPGRAAARSASRGRSPGPPPGRVRRPRGGERRAPRRP